MKVTLPAFENVYVYAATKLWIAYGIVIALTAVAATIGLAALIASGASYSQDFSNIFRVAHSTLMTVELRAEDLDGKDPLPSYLAGMKLTLRGSKVNDENLSIDMVDPPARNRMPEAQQLLQRAQTR